MIAMYSMKRNIGWKSQTMKKGEHTLVVGHNSFRQGHALISKRVSRSAH